MSAPIARICDPRRQNLEDAILEAKRAAQASRRFELSIVRFLQIQCLEASVDFPAIFRGLEILGRVTEDTRLVSLLRPFLRSGVPKVASKAVLIAGRHCSDLKWLKKTVEETDARTRANLIESLWRRNGPGVDELMENALWDRHHRVTANAVYGLYLNGSEVYHEGIERLYRSPDCWCRRSAIWVLRTIAGDDAAGRLKTFILDPDPGVRHAAFNALVYLRDKGAKKEEKTLSITRGELPEPVINLQADY